MADVAVSNLAVVLPSRGVIYSETVEEMYRELNSLDIPYRVFFSHARPIPDCFEIPTLEALKTNCSHILYVEEDMVLPKGILKKMVKRVKHALACDYPVGGSDGGTVMYDPDGTAFFTGCGLLLVDASLLRKLPRPIWRDDVRWVPHVEDGYIYFDISTDDTEHYGQQDVAFGLRLYANGMPIEVMSETIGQRRVVERGEAGSNRGFHKIVEKMTTVRRDDLSKIKHIDSRPEIIIDGKRVKVDHQLYTKLKNPELPDYHKQGRAIFNMSDDIKDWILFKEEYAR